MKQLITSFIALLSFFCNGQTPNLVPNPSFENVKFTPTTFSSSATAFDTAMVSWFSGNISSPDIISAKLLDKSRSYDIPTAKTGKVMAGIINNLGMWTEYINVELKTSIKKGNTYYGEFWYLIVNPTNTTTDIHDSQLNPAFGLWFNHGEVSSKKGFINEIPQIASTQKQVCQPSIWKKISGTFVADDDYSHISIGQFQTAYNTQLNGSIMIDDVLVRETESLKLEVGATLVLENIIFKSGTAVLEEASYVSLESLVQSLKTSSNIQLAINGHTDNIGDDNENQLLSENRAKTIYEYLILQGIKKDFLQYKGFGEVLPVADNTSSAGRKKNRRVEFQVLKQGS